MPTSTNTQGTLTEGERSHINDTSTLIFIKFSVYNTANYRNMDFEIRKTIETPGKD